jgi:hypothetical protein
MTVEETAAVLEVPPATVKTRLWRANLALRSALGADLAAAFTDAFPFAGARCDRLTATVLGKLPAVGAAAPPSNRGGMSRWFALFWLQRLWFSLPRRLPWLPESIAHHRRRHFGK